MASVCLVYLRQMAPKSFVNPRFCITLFNHYCDRPLNLQPKKKIGQTIFDVNPALAMSHHYRKCDYRKSTCEDYLKDQLSDNIALKFKVKLRQRVELVLKTLNYNVSDLSTSSR